MANDHGKANKIIVTGPESSGKTTLTRALAAYYGAVWVPEYARTYLDGLNRLYQESDLVRIAKGQLAKEEEYARRANGLLFCDTSMLVLKVWSDYKYGRCAAFIQEQLKKQKKAFFLLCQPDIPWTFDRLRENPNDRDELFAIYRQNLQAFDFSFRIINGNREERLDKAVAAADAFIKRKQ